jgi:hypothetical protein
VYITIRKYRLKRSPSEAHDAVVAGLLPILTASQGFQGYWTITCDDGDFAGVSIFDTEANSTAATAKTMEWVFAHVRELVELPAAAMFGGSVTKLA